MPRSRNQAFPVGKPASPGDSEHPHLKRELANDVSRRIFKATIEEFAAKGILGARLASISEAAGVSDPAFYRYFPSLRDAALYILSAHYWHPLNLQFSAFQKVTANPVLLFEAVISSLIKSTEDNPGSPWISESQVFRIAVAQMRNPFLLPDSLLDPEYLIFLEKLSHILRHGQEQGMFTAEVRSELLARSVVNTLHGLLAERQVGQRQFVVDEQEIQTIARQLVGFVGSAGNDPMTGSQTKSVHR